MALPEAETQSIGSSVVSEAWASELLTIDHMHAGNLPKDVYPSAIDEIWATCDHGECPAGL
jgi:hypothetical protein